MAVLKLVETEQELIGLKQLQTNNLRRLIGEEEAMKEGFVTSEYALSLLQQMHEIHPSIIVKEGEDDIFLIASSYHDNGWRTNTRIYRAKSLSTDEEKDLQFVEHQRIITHGCHDAEIGQFKTGTFVFLSEDRSDSSSTIDSSLLVFNPSTRLFQLHQRIPSDGAHAAELFEGPDGAVYLFIANFGDRLGQRYASFSTLWRQESSSGGGGQGQFIQIDQVASQGATDVEHFVLQGGRHFLGLSNEGDVGNRKHQLSVFYELVKVEEADDL